MAVAKKAVPKAVGRNRIKRLVRESFREQMSTLPVEMTLDLVVLPTAQAAEQSNKALFESLSAHWQQLNKKAATRFIEPGKSIKDTR